MSLTKNIYAYNDVRVVLESALSMGGARYDLGASGKAVRWRQRAYHYRKLLIEADKAAHPDVPGYIPSTKWDTMSLTLDGTCVVIEFNKLTGEIRALDGSAPPPELQTITGGLQEGDDELMREARRLVEEKGL